MWIIYGLTTFRIQPISDYVFSTFNNVHKQKKAYQKAAFIICETLWQVSSNFDKTSCMGLCTGIHDLGSLWKDGHLTGLKRLRFLSVGFSGGSAYSYILPFLACFLFGFTIYSSSNLVELIIMVIVLLICSSCGQNSLIKATFTVQYSYFDKSDKPLWLTL